MFIYISVQGPGLNICKNINDAIENDNIKLFSASINLHNLQDECYIFNVRKGGNEQMSKKIFGTSVFGYNKRQVEQYMVDMRKDYEEELSKKRSRMLELVEENRKMRSQIEEMKTKIAELSEKEAYISKVLVKAEEKAHSIIEEGRQMISHEIYQMELEKNKWKERCKEIRRQLIDFERTVCTILENFYSEINYLASKEISENMLFYDAVDDLDEEKHFVEKQEQRILP
jgi:cell division initiation protein